jgi:hypothetical protein
VELRSALWSVVRVRLQNFETKILRTADSLVCTQYKYKYIYLCDTTIANCNNAQCVIGEEVSISTYKYLGFWAWEQSFYLCFGTTLINIWSYLPLNFDLELKGGGMGRRQFWIPFPADSPLRFPFSLAFSAPLGLGLGRSLAHSIPARHPTHDTTRQ